MHGQVGFPIILKLSQIYHTEQLRIPFIVKSRNYIIRIRSDTRSC